MQLELITAPNWPLEVHSALAQCADTQDDSLITLARRFKDLGDEQALAYTQLLQQLAGDWGSRLPLPEELRFLYQPQAPGSTEGPQGCLADAIFFCRFDPRQQNPGALCEGNLQAFRASNGREFLLHVLSGAFGTEDGSGLPEDSPLDPRQVPGLLEQCGLPAASKWNVMRAYLNYEHYCRLLYQTLEQALPLVRQPLMGPIAQAALQSWAAFWQQHAQQGDLRQVLARMVKVDLGALCLDQVRLYPGLVRFNWCSFEQGSANRQPANLLVGLVFQNSRRFFDAHSFTADQLCSQLKLLSDKSKFEILRLIKDSPAYGQELAAKLGLTTATISHHMSALLNCGLVVVERQANRLYYRADKAQLNALLEAVRSQLG